MYVDMDNNNFIYTDERFADLQMLRYRVAGFDSLSLKQKTYIYYLAKATLAGRDITTDQYGRFNLDIRRTLEAILLSRPEDRSHDMQEMTVYLKRLWFSNGIYHHYGCEKFVPGFSEDWFRKTVSSIDATKLPTERYGSVSEMLSVLCKVIFDPACLPMRVNQADGDDLVKTSACNLYKDVSQQEAESFYAAKADPKLGDKQPSWGLNSKLVKEDGKLKELAYTVGGLYGKQLTQIVHWLGKAKPFAETDGQKRLIDKLIQYYTTGDLRLFDSYSIDWLKEQEGDVDFINGFIEVYGDPIGIKGTWEGLVELRDAEATRRTKLIADNAQWFEDHSPVDARFKKQRVKGVSAHVVEAVMLGGEEYPSSAIGINLPNADWIRAEYGSKSVTISNLTEAYDKAAQGNGFNEEFVEDDHTRSLIERYGSVCDNLHTDLHECLGHGSGQLLAGVSADALKSYGSTIEEARADLFGLYYLADPKLLELGLLDSPEAYKSQYYHYMMNGLLTQLVRIKPGNNIEEAHMRNRALIARWCLAHAEGSVELVSRDGKTYVRVNDYSKLRSLFGNLLAEIQRIKSEGDYNAARAMVETYAVKVDPKLHAEILGRYEKLGIAPYKGFINPWMKASTDENGNITDVKLDYTESFTHQMLRYSKQY